MKGLEKGKPFGLLGAGHGRRSKHLQRKSVPHRLDLNRTWPPTLNEKGGGISPEPFLPRQVICILPLQLGEQYCNASVRGMLNLFLQAAGVDGEGARMRVHLVGALIYFVPLVGERSPTSSSVTLWWRYWVRGVFSVEGLYTKLGVTAALTLVGVGLGLLKPCLQALASHHVEMAPLPPKTTQKALDNYFGLGFAVGSLGIVLASFLTPILTGIGCGGSQQCYPLGFGAATLVVAVAGLLYILGSGEASGRLLEDGEVGRLMRLFVMSLPLSFFWMLYDQSATSWQAQYELMDHNWVGVGVRTELMANVGCIMLVLLIPILTRWVDPLLERAGMKIEGIPRMAMGFFMLIVGFVISNFVQAWVEASLVGAQVLRHAGRVSSCEGCLSGAWQFPQWFFLSLGEALLGTATPQVAYGLGGSRFRAMGPGLLLMTNSLGNLLIILLDAAPSMVSAR
ncbi:hypothetical protein L0F63_001195 [Massospora cicadina]|nr:hypothetical protein L0F63_001195 [Massospora cicadina]